MEWGLFISSSVGFLNIDDYIQVMNNELRAGGIGSGNIKPSRLYFGHETCQRALPLPGGLVEAINESKKRRMKFTLVTPYVTEKGLEKLTVLFRVLVNVKPFCEVVVNDWGTLYLLRRNFPSFRPVLGRLLNKMLRDPRILNTQSTYPEIFFQPCTPAGRYMKRILTAARVKRVELDNPIQGFNGVFKFRRLKLSLYIPYGIITTGRICLLGSWGLRTGEKFRASTENCSGRCRHYRLRMNDGGGSIEERGGEYGIRIIQSGNSVLDRQEKRMLLHGLSGAGKIGIDRFIYQVI